MEGTLDLLITAALCGALLVSGGLALCLLPWTDSETDDTVRVLVGFAARARAAAGMGMVRATGG